MNVRMRSAARACGSGWSWGTVAWALFVAAWCALPVAWIVLGATHVGGFSDAVDYVLVAEFFRETFSGTVSPLAADRFASTRFPPLFPLVLAAAGADAAHQVVAFRVSGTSALLAFVAIWFWLRRELDDVLSASWAVLAFACVPGLFLLLIYPASETLFMAIVYLALAVAPDPRLRPVGVVTLAALVSIVPLARTIGIALVAAACVAIAFMPYVSRKQKLFACVLALLPAVLWASYRAALPDADQYSEVLDLSVMLRELGGWHGLLLGQPVALFRGYVELLDPHHRTAAIAVAAMLAATSTPGLYRALAERRLYAWFLLFYWAIVWVWPFPHEVSRLLLPTLPIVLLCACGGIRELMIRVAGLKRGVEAASVTGILVLMLLLATAPTLVQFGRRVLNPVAPTLEPFKRGETYFSHRSQQHAELVLTFEARLLFAMLALHEAVLASECVYTTIPEMVSLHGRVNVVRIPRLDTSRDVRAQLHRCRYFLIHQATTRQLGHPPLYPLEFIADWTRPVFQSWEESPAGRYPAVVLLKAVEPDTLPATDPGN